MSFKYLCFLFARFLYYSLLAESYLVAKLAFIAAKPAYLTFSLAMYSGILADRPSLSFSLTLSLTRSLAAPLNTICCNCGTICSTTFKCIAKAFISGFSQLFNVPEMMCNCHCGDVRFPTWDRKQRKYLFNNTYDV